MLKRSIVALVIASFPIISFAVYLYLNARRGTDMPFLEYFIAVGATPFAIIAAGIYLWRTR